jgi:hypothetical protein
MKTDWKYARMRNDIIEFFDELPKGDTPAGVIEIKTALFFASIGRSNCQIFVTGNKIEHGFSFNPTYDNLDKYAGPFRYTRFKKRPYIEGGWHELKKRTPCTIEIYNVLAIMETANILRARFA